jgi:hypothetical protein
LHRARNGHAARLSFLVSARHHPDEVDRAVEALAEAAARCERLRGVWR